MRWRLLGLQRSATGPGAGRGGLSTRQAPTPEGRVNVYGNGKNSTAMNQVKQINHRGTETQSRKGEKRKLFSSRSFLLCVSVPLWLICFTSKMAQPLPATANIT